MIHHREEGLDLRSPTNFANSDIQHECLDLEKVAAEVSIGRQRYQ